MLMLELLVHLSTDSVSDGEKLNVLIKTSQVKKKHIPYSDDHSKMSVRQFQALEFPVDVISLHRKTFLGNLYP